MKTITIPSTAARDQRDAFIQQAMTRIQRALARMRRHREKAMQRGGTSLATSTEDSGHAYPRDH